MIIHGRKIDNFSRPYIVAELSGNHKGDLARAMQLVDAAFYAGADAIKLQTYTADTMTMNIDKEDFYINDPSSPWHGRHLYDLYKEAYTPWEWHEKLFQRAKNHGLDYFSSPFDETSVDFLESLDVPCYKIASFENVDAALIKKVAKMNKPVIVSTGAADLSDIEEVMDSLQSSGCVEYALLKCTSAYPAPHSSCNLRTIPDMACRFGCPVGLSDHSLGIIAPILSVGLGACVIEKHLTLDRSDGAVDSAFSLNPTEFKKLTESVATAWESMGNVSYTISECESQSKYLKRSLYYAVDLPAGTLVTESDIRCIRPGFGARPSQYDCVVGKQTSRSVTAGDPVQLDGLA